MKSKLKTFFYQALPIILIAIFALFFLEIKLVISLTLGILLLTSYITFKEKIGQELIIAFLFALIVTSYYFYEYTTFNLLIGRINLFPLVSWTTALVLLREIYERLKTKHNFILISIIYIMALFVLEYIGFFLLNIRLNNNFSSLFGLGIIHAPLGMKLFYIFAGPIYILITNYLKVR